MEHVAIMKTSWGLTGKILSGKKKIESRWYKTKRAPWGRIESGDVVYFKDSGKPVMIRAEVDKVIDFEDLTPQKVRQILARYGKDDGISEDKRESFFELFKDKKYCLLIFLKNPRKIKPFEIDKKGFGMQAAWLSSTKIKKIKLEMI